MHLRAHTPESTVSRVRSAQLQPGLIFLCMIFELCTRAHANVAISRYGIMELAIPFRVESSSIRRPAASILLSESR